MIRIPCPHQSVRDILTDVTIQTEFGQYRAHKIFLAKYSKKFREDFKQNNSNIYEILEISRNTFQVIMDAIYLNKFKISRNNVHSLLYITSYYKFEQFKELTLQFIQDILDYLLDWSDLSEFLERFTEPCYLDDIVRIFAPKIAHFYSTYQKIDDLISISQFPKIFSSTLIQLKAKNDLTTPKILKYLDKATYEFKHSKEIRKDDKDHTYQKGSKIEELILLNLTEKNKAIHKIEDLYNKELIDLQNKEVRYYITEYQCDYIPVNEMRPILKDYFQIIRNNSKKFEECPNKTNTKPISRWPVFAWLSSIKSPELNSVPKIELFKFLQTLGGLSEEYIDYSSFGFFNAKRMPEIKLDCFNEANAFVDDEKPFIAIPEQSKESSGLVIDLGASTMFIPEKIFIDMNVKSRICPTTNTNNRLQPVPKHIFVKIDDKKEIKLEIKENAVFADIKAVNSELKQHNDLGDDKKCSYDQMEKDFGKNFGFHKLVISPSPGTTVFRIRYIEIEGSFATTF